MGHHSCMGGMCVYLLCYFILLQVTQSVIRNVAVNKTASQSLTLHWAKNPDQTFYWNASYAVDGKKERRERTKDYVENNPSCSGTNGQDWPSWWSVDLGAVYEISRVVIYGRTRDPPVQLRGFQMYIQNRSEGDAQSLQYTDKTNATAYNNAGGQITILLDAKPNGRYVRIVMTKWFIPDQHPPLILCEVEVFGDCPLGVYGETCGQHCGRCKDGENCNTQSGHCTNGCQLGYKGDLCKTDNNLIRRIEVTTSMSSMFSNYSSSNAVDSKENTDADTCRCCAGASKKPSWWRLDLGYQYPIKFIIFIGRSDTYTQQSRNFTIYKDFSDSLHGRHFLYHNNATQGHRFVIALNPPVVLQRLEVTSQIELTICELKIIESEFCPSGLFGPHCRQECHCSDTSPCKRSEGICHTPGCEPGWRGSSCNTTCNYGRFGQDCRYHCHCLDSRTCNRINGSCPLGVCAPGWQADNCSIACDEGIFGQNCTAPCHCLLDEPCYHINGSCPSRICAPGWQGDNCSIACDKGTFGQNCISTCHCLHDEPCYQINGSCPVGICAPGWQGDNCSIACDEGLFGQDCMFPCHCIQDETCYHINGSCPSGMCAPGWRADNCSIECDERTFGQNCIFPCHCLHGETCYHINGSCPSGVCAAGWRGDNCSIECTEGTFGQHCSSPCHCLDDNRCHHINGSCHLGLCARGWQGNNCSLACTGGTFGQNCSSHCHCLHNQPCDHIKGSCHLNVCAPGWTAGNCSIECDKGTFGHNCSSQCHCFQNHSCNTSSGTCPFSLCASGWNGESCQEECSGNTFGQNCSLECHCVEAGVCHHINGSCTRGGCKTGWEGRNCSVESKPLTGSADNPPVGVIVGPVVALAAILIVVAAVILYRKRVTPKKAKRGEQNFLDLSDNIRSESKPNQSLQNKMPTSGASRGQDKEPVQLKEDHAYYTFDSKETKIQLSQLWNYINLAYNLKCEKLYEEFQKLPSGLIYDCNEARKIENAKKTRYKQMYAYDHSRVILKRDDGNASTYINASYIDGYRKEKKFIASQGPTEAMVSDFWEMVIQEKSTVIVMLTNVIEHAVVKCLQYWATEEGEQQIFGDVKVATSKITTFPDYIIREFIVTKGIQKPIKITQAHFTAWPDKDVPDTAWHLVNFWRKINDLVGMKKQPIIVHCSAGIGRTGTYIALDNLHAQAKAEGYIQPLGVVKRMRHQRVNMVQTKEQYVFLHEAVAESLFLGVKSVKANAFEAVFKSLLETDKTTGTTGLEQQYQFLQDSLSSTAAESEYYNTPLATESDEYRPKGSRASTADRNEQPSTCYIQNYAGKSSYIMTKAPETDPVEQLWSLVEKHNVKTIMTFHNDMERNEKMNDERPKGQNKDEHSKPRVELLDTNQEKQYTVKTFEVTGSKSDKGSSTIKQFVFTSWKERSDVPTDAASVITFLNAVQRWQPTVDEAHPVLINCESGFERSALICILLNEFERVRLNEEVNILETVKRIRERNANLTPDYEQYKFCYSAVLEYVRQSDVYMNV